MKKICYRYRSKKVVLCIYAWGSIPVSPRVFSSAFGALEGFVAFAVNEKRLARDLPEVLQEDARWHEPATIVNRDCWERIRSGESFGW